MHVDSHQLITGKHGNGTKNAENNDNGEKKNNLLLINGLGL